MHDAGNWQSNAIFFLHFFFDFLCEAVGLFGEESTKAHTYTHTQKHFLNTAKPQKKK